MVESSWQCIHKSATVPAPHGLFFIGPISAKEVTGQIGFDIFGAGGKGFTVHISEIPQFQNSEGAL
jgi:hypothetical protein